MEADGGCKRFDNKIDRLVQQPRCKGTELSCVNHKWLSYEKDLSVMKPVYDN